MPLISAELLAQPLPFARTPLQRRSQQATVQTQEAQAKGLELQNLSLEQKQALDADIRALQEGIARARLGDGEGADRALRSTKSGFLAQFADELAEESRGPQLQGTNLLSPRMEEFAGQVFSALGHAGVDVEPKVVAQGASLVDARTGEVIFHDPKPESQTTTFRAPTAEESARFGIDPRTHQINDATREIRQIPRAAQGEGDVRSRKIADAQRVFDLTEQQAVSLVDGHSRSEINEKTGQIVTIDQVNAMTGEGPVVTEQPVSGDRPETPSPAPGQTLWDLSEAAFGPVSSLTAKGAAALSFFDVNPDEAATEAQQIFRAEFRGLLRSFVLNPRFPIAEVERLRKDFSLEPSFFKGAGTARKEMQGIDKTLSVQLRQAEDDARNPDLDIETRQAQAANASAIRNFRAVMGVPAEMSDLDAINVRLDEIKQRKAEIEAQLGITSGG